jgi:hypothetical protein
MKRKKCKNTGYYLTWFASRVAPFWIVVMRWNEIIKFDYWSNKQLKKDIVEFWSFKIVEKCKKVTQKMISSFLQ